MSAISLGASAIVVDLIATDIKYKNERRKIVADITLPGALPTVGFHVILPAANPTAFTLPDGKAVGDIVEFCHRSGANVANITPSALHGAVTAVDMTGGSYTKFIWLGQQWYIIGRCGNGAAASTAVANYPVLS